MKKLLLCSALIFGVFSESSAWEVDLHDSAEPLTPKLSLIAVQERMNQLKESSREEAEFRKQFRHLYNNWLSDSRKWSAEGKNSTLDNILGYCKYEKIKDFKTVLENIEKKIVVAQHIRDTEGDREGVDFIYQLTDLMNIENSMNGHLDGTAITLPGHFNFSYLSSLWEKDDIGVTVNPSFWSELINVWTIQYVEGKDGDPGSPTPADIEKYRSFKDYFSKTDTLDTSKDPGPWDLSGKNTLDEMLAVFTGARATDKTPRDRMTFHLNVVARILDILTGDNSPQGDKLDTFINSFRYYTYLSFNEARYYIRDN